jgi:hypothetical protein
MARRVDLEVASAEDVCLEEIGPFIPCMGKVLENEGSNQNGRNPSSGYKEYNDEPIVLSRKARSNTAHPETNSAEPVLSAGYDSSVSNNDTSEDHEKSSQLQLQGLPIDR